MKILSTNILAASFILFAGFGLSATANAGTITVGNDPTHQGGQLDGCGNCGYVVPTAFSAAGATVTSVSYWATGLGDITPVLLSGHDNGDGTTTFTVTGVGTDYNPTGNGLNTFAFGLTSGSDVTGANTYFGFFDTSGPTVSYDYDGSGAGTFLVGTMPGLNASFTDPNTAQHGDSQDNLNNRLYSIQATAVTSPIPEPSSLILLGTGLVSLMGAGRRK